MLAILLLALPIFGLILAGWVMRTAGVLGAESTRELNRFVVWLALPALLFHIVAGARWGDIWQPAFIAVFGLGMMAVFVPTALVAWRMGRPLADAAIDGLNGGYSNTAYIGLPLALAAIGPQAQPGVLVATILTMCLLFGSALLLIELDLNRSGGGVAVAGRVAKSLACNPLIVAPALGGIVLAAGVGLAEPLDRFLDLLGGAASPCALVALGTFLADKRASPADRPASVPVGPVAALTALKLVVHPLATWLLAVFVFRLDAPATNLAVLVAALPSGTGPFMAAEFYGREAQVTAQVVLASTVLSLFTVTLLLSWQ